MYKKCRKVISKLLTLTMFFTTAFCNLNGVVSFASDDSTGRKIDVWDFGAVQTSGDEYNNIISTATLDNLATVKAGTFTGEKTDFGDLSIAVPNANDRLYYSQEGSTKDAGSNSSGAGTQINYNDGYTSCGMYYCNGTAGNAKRYLTISNVEAGDKITVYGGTSNGDESIHFVYAAIKVDGSGKVTVTPDTSSPQDTVANYTTKAQKVDFIAKYSGAYQIYVGTDHSGKPFFNRVVRTPGVKVSGKINLNGNKIPQCCSLTFVNQATGESTDAAINEDSSFSTILSADYKYTALIKGAAGYKISDDTKIINISTSDVENGINNINLNVVVNALLKISGSIKGFDNSYDTSKLQIKLAPPKESLSEAVSAEVDTAKKTFTACVENGVQYTALISGVNDYEITAGSDININADGKQDITVTPKNTYTATGKFQGLSSTAKVQNITFANVDDGYTYKGTVKDGSYTVNLRNGAYTINAICTEDYSTSTHVVVNGENAAKDILFHPNSTTSASLSLVPDLYVGDASKKNNYNTVKAALDAAAKMNPTSEAQRITIHIVPGTYREQVKISTPYITLVNSDPSKEVKITWYYGIGYKYYSIGADGFYNADCAYDKYTKNIAAKWGGTVYLTNTAANFKAENIVFENSFNKYITDEELADGVELGNVAGSTINVQRKAYTDAVSRPATERAAAMLIEANNVEFNKCSFLGSQDTLYTGGVGTNSQYYKNCFIEGNTDYIFGDGNAVFDNCRLNFCGYSDQATGGYLTAAKDVATYGYLFRNCTITANNNTKQAPGCFGRPWGQGAKVTFMNTKLENNSIIDAKGWTDMSNAKPENANYKEYNTTCNGEGVDTSSRRVPALSDDASIPSVNSYLGDFSPKYLAACGDSAPTFKTNPFFTTDDDINIPYTGNTVTLGYEFNEKNDNLNDSSLIQWYRVSKDGTETLIKEASAYISKTYKLTKDDIDCYIKAIVTPELVNGVKGETKSITLDNLVREGSSSGAVDINKTQDGHVNIYIAGDSTVKSYGPTIDTGAWGEFLQKYFDASKVNVVNYANGGRSSRSFINEGSLDKIAANIKAGDYLLIQFGHNDCANQPQYLIERFTSVGEPDANGIYPSTPGVKEATPSSLAANNYGDMYYPYSTGTLKWYLQQYIDVAKNAGATPILVTPVSRQYFTSSGTIKPHHDATDTTTGTVTSTNNAYVTAVNQLGMEQGVKVIDMFTDTKNCFETAYKDDPSANSGSSPLAKAVMNVSDSTHNNKIGGFYNAALMATEIKKLGYNISGYVMPPVKAGGIDSHNNVLFEVDSNSKVSIYTPDANGTYTSQLNKYWTDKTQELVDSLKVKGK